MRHPNLWISCVPSSADRDYILLMASGVVNAADFRRWHCREHIDPSQQMVLGDAIFKPELVEQPALIPPLPPHRRPTLRCRRSISHRNHGLSAISSPLSTASVKLR